MSAAPNFKIGFEPAQLDWRIIAEARRMMRRGVPLEQNGDNLGRPLPRSRPVPLENNGGRVVSFWTAEKLALRDSLKGLTDREMAEALGCSRSAICGRRRREKLNAKPEPAPIRPSMRRLAEFDPVVRRALEEREAA